MINLDNHSLMEAYYSALELDLDTEFIEMLKKELEARNLVVLKRQLSSIK
ncbi:sporulation histidine kinase inhibitor Sda [Aquibacillus salsiterrae]|uniref:Sporulation histidine kinase inhibitor Sda n=1 Tax=Aquibacillus salsiterrae TaxID=2950439 RepID=A0A9X3WCB3_9BACI|nr:sporulation histidine kinase inhibitor Sda [Aquibacillus salsiterrae]MDC3416233.1 sporulation histidine kinase inhibitor Sda [Aquibacillus salsiterrae]